MLRYSETVLISVSSGTRRAGQYAPHWCHGVVALLLLARKWHAVDTKVKKHARVFANHLIRARWAQLSAARVIMAVRQEMFRQEM